MDSIRAKIKRRFSHKDQNANFDEHDSGDEETQAYLDKEAEEAEKEGHPMGRPNSLLNRMISHGNKKTEDELEAARRAAAANPEAGAADRGADKVVTQR